MKAMLAASALLLTVVAADAVWYVVSDLATGKCTSLSNQPDTSKYKILATFPTREEAEAATGNMSDCQ